MEFYERVSGARLHAAYNRIGGVQNDLPKGSVEDIKLFLQQFNSRINEIEELLSKNRIWRKRLKNVGVITKKDSLSLSLTGVLLRSTGVSYDLRINQSYEIYQRLQFQTVIGKTGDCLDRYYQRMEEIRQSAKIIKQVIDKLPSGPVKTDDKKIASYSRKKIKLEMQNLISHFKLYSTGMPLRNASFYTGIEAPKGQFGVFIATTENSKPYRCKIRAPGFFHLQAIDKMTKKANLADVVTVIGTQDIVFGEVDR